MKNGVPAGPSRPADDDREAWKAYWVTQDQPWRTEPEIDQKRQAELEQRRAIVPVAGYGYRPRRSFLAYLLVIFGFATAYYVLGHTNGPALSPLGAFVFSMASFHGRGFFPGSNISLDDPLTVLAALEALVGLIIEVTFIATLTQRFFNR